MTTDGAAAQPEAGEVQPPVKLVEVLPPRHVRGFGMAIHLLHAGIKNTIVNPLVMRLYSDDIEFTLSINPDRSLRIYVARPTRADVPREVLNKAANDFNGFTDLAKAVLFEREGKSPMFVMLMDVYFAHGLIVANLKAQFEHLVTRVKPLLADRSLLEDAEVEIVARDVVLN